MEYDKIGFMCGIEIHQQLEGKKLFCRCPTTIRKDDPDFVIERKLKSSAGESGITDQAAKHEEKKAKIFQYQGYYDTTCLVETDEEPPHEINMEALEAAIQVSKMLNAKVTDQVQFMRKIVVDGSNVSGFQRTALVGRDGFIEVDGKKVGIPTICLEEEACQVTERGKERDIYNLSRLGIPLIELGTDPTISTPQEARKVAEKLGMVLRSTGKCKRGIGSIRQDVNVSIAKGARTEIKGFQDLKSIPKVIDNEIGRQLKLLDEGKTIEPGVRKAEPDFSTSFLRPMPGAQRMYPETDIRPILPDTSQIEEAELIDDKIDSLAKDFTIPRDLAAYLVKKDMDFRAMVKSYPHIKPSFLANTASSIPKEHHDDVFSRLNKGEITKDSVTEISELLKAGKKVDYSSYKAADDGEIEEEIKKIISENKGAPIGALMGEAMKRFRGKVEGKKVMELIKKNQ